LKIDQEPAEPIAEANKAEFEALRDRVIAELNGTATEDMLISEDDIQRKSATPTAESNPESTASTAGEQPKAEK
jgi:hypothetical protein